MSATAPAIMNDAVSGKSLPFELIETILIRLPVKPLKRFRAVEKSWRSLIDSEDFAKAHLRRSLQTNSHRCLISGMSGFYRISLDSLDEAQSLKPEFEYDTGDVHAASNFCNGMVVVKRDPEPPVLWNPFTREYKVLPKCPLDFLGKYDQSISCKSTYGFGYDSKNDDYKVLKVTLFHKPSWFMFSEDWIYGLKSDCWKRTAVTYYGREEWPIHVSGYLHTVVQSGPGPDRVKIMGFSVESETDHEVPKPDSPRIHSEDLVYVFLDVFEGCLVLGCNYGSWVEIWVMEEYGVKESWKALISFPVDPSGFVRPLVYYKGRDKILLNCSYERFAVCGLRAPSIQMFNMPYTFSPALCVETLISPNGWSKRNCNVKISTEKQNKDGQPNKGKKKTLKKKRDNFLSSGFKLVL